MAEQALRLSRDNDEWGHEAWSLCLLGEIASSRSLAAAPEAQRAQVPMISPGSTNPKVTEVGD